MTEYIPESLLPVKAYLHGMKSLVTGIQNQVSDLSYNVSWRNLEILREQVWGDDGVPISDWAVSPVGLFSDVESAPDEPWSLEIERDKIPPGVRKNQFYVGDEVTFKYDVPPFGSRIVVLQEAEVYFAGKLGRMFNILDIKNIPTGTVTVTPPPVTGPYRYRLALRPLNLDIPSESKRPKESW